MRRLALCLALSAPLFTSPALAQSQCSALVGEACACAIPLDALQNGVFGQLNPGDPTGGGVLVTKIDGSSPPGGVVNLNVGDSAIVLANGSAFLNAGSSCGLDLPAQSSLVIRAVDGCACASLVKAQKEAVLDEGGGGGAGVVGVVVGAVVVGGGLAALLLLGEGDSASEQ